jgi:hypothetical protein
MSVFHLSSGDQQRTYCSLGTFWKWGLTLLISPVIGGTYHWHLVDAKDATNPARHEMVTFKEELSFILH